MAVKVFEIIVHALEVDPAGLLAVDGRSMTGDQLFVVAIEQRPYAVSQLGMLPKKVTG